MEVQNNGCDDSSDLHPEDPLSNATVTSSSTTTKTTTTSTIPNSKKGNGDTTIILNDK